MKNKITLILLISALVISSAFANAANINIEQDENKGKLSFNNLDLTDGYTDNGLGTQSNMFDICVAEDNNIETLFLNIKENVDILDDGTAALSIVMDVSTPKLVDLYKDAFGISDDLTEVDMDVPINTYRDLEIEYNTETKNKKREEAVRDKFYKGIYEEQKSLFGFYINKFENTRIFSEDLQNKLKITVDCLATPTYSDFDESDSKVKLSMTSSSDETINEFIKDQVGTTRIMLNYFSGKQLLEKNIDVSINFPNSANILDISGYKDNIDFGDGTGVDITSRIESDNKVKLDQIWSIGEDFPEITVQNMDNARLSIEYESNTISTSNFYKICNSDDSTSEFLINSGDDWSTGLDLTLFSKKGSGTWHGVDYSYNINVSLYANLGGGITFDTAWNYAKVVATCSLTVGINVTADFEGEYENDFKFGFGGMSATGENYGWAGSQPFGVVVTFEPEAGLEIAFEGELHIKLNPEAGFTMEIGGELDPVLPPNFKPIFNYDPSSSFDYSITGEASLTIKPYFGFNVDVLLFGCVGPSFKPIFYLLGEIGASVDGGDVDIFWHAEFGFEFYIGISFFDILELYWSDPIVSLPIVEWDSKDYANEGFINPPDNTPPVTTINTHPRSNGYNGPFMFFGFDASDPGADASGIEYTELKIPDAKKGSHQTWHYWNPGSINEYEIEVNPGDPSFKIYYRSKDKEGNLENQKTEVINLDLKAPNPDDTIGYSGGELSQIDTNHIVVTKGIKLYLNADDDKTQHRIWVRASYKDNNGDWKYCFDNEWLVSSWNVEDFTLSFPENGKFKIEWATEDKVWNSRSGPTFLVDVVSGSDAPSVSITKPENYLYLHGRKFFPYSYPVLFLTDMDARTNVDESSSGIKHVKFYFDGELQKTDTSSPYTWSFSGTYIGSSNLEAEAKNNFGKTDYDSKKVMMLNIGSSSFDDPPICNPGLDIDENEMPTRNEYSFKVTNLAGAQADSELETLVNDINENNTCEILFVYDVTYGDGESESVTKTPSDSDCLNPTFTHIYRGNANGKNINVDVTFIIKLDLDGDGHYDEDEIGTGTITISDEIGRPKSKSIDSSFQLPILNKLYRFFSKYLNILKDKFTFIR